MSSSALKNIHTYGFARFYYPGEEDIQNNVWLRDIEIEKFDSAKNKKIRIALPSDKLIPLSTEKRNKIIHWNNFVIKSGAECLPDIHFLAQRAGWNQTLNDIKRMVHNDPPGSFNAVLNDGDGVISLGSGTVFAVGQKLDWIGMILVHPELRRQGIARKIMQRCIMYARLTRKSALLGLDATPMGLSLYRSLGFKESFRIWRSTIDTNTLLSFNNHILIKKLKSVEDIMAYLDKKSVADKIQLFNFLFFLHKNGCFMAVQNNTICGIALSRPGRLKPFIGHLIADTDEIARALLKNALEYWAKKGYNSVFLDIPEYHFHKKAQKVDNEDMFLPPQHCRLADAIKPVRLFFRMYHLINEHGFKKYKSQSPKTDYDKALEYSVSCYEQTQAYIRNEKEKLLPFLKCIAGPEMS